MFGKPADKGNGKFAPQRRAAADVARIEGGGLVQIIVTSFSPITFYFFLNDKTVSQMDVESLEVNIDVAAEGEGDTVVRAGLSRYAKSITGEQTTQYTNLFPCTLEIVALGRRISITAANADSVENLFVSLGLRPDGASTDLEGLKSVHIMVTNVLIDAKLTWADGQTEDILPH
jgi:hypothetical protein